MTFEQERKKIERIFMKEDETSTTSKQTTRREFIKGTLKDTLKDIPNPKEDVKYGYKLSDVEEENLEEKKENKDESEREIPDMLHNGRSGEYHPKNYADLRRLHGYKVGAIFKTFSWTGGDFIDRIVEEMTQKYSMRRKNVFTNALIYYQLFMEKNYNKLCKEEEKMAQKGEFDDNKKFVKETYNEAYNQVYSDERGLKDNDK